MFTPILIVHYTILKVVRAKMHSCIFLFSSYLSFWASDLKHLFVYHPQNPKNYPLLPVNMPMILPTNPHQPTILTSLHGLHPAPEAGHGKVYLHVLVHPYKVSMGYFPFHSCPLPCFLSTDLPWPLLVRSEVSWRTAYTVLHSPPIYCQRMQSNITGSTTLNILG